MKTDSKKQNSLLENLNFIYSLKSEGTSSHMSVTVGQGAGLGFVWTVVVQPLLRPHLVFVFSRGLLSVTPPPAGAAGQSGGGVSFDNVSREGRQHMMTVRWLPWQQQQYQHRGT